VSAACLWALAVRLDWASVGAALAAAHWGLAAAAAALTLLGLVLRALRWRLLLGSAAPPWPLLLATYTVGVAAGLLLPASGDFARALLLGTRSQLRTSYVLGSVAVEKLLDTATVVALFGAGLWLAAAPAWLGRAAGPAALAVGLALLGLMVVVLAAPRPGLTPPAWLPRGLAAAVERLGLAAADRWGRFASGAANVVRLPWPLRIATGLLTLLVWGNACLATVLALAAFGLGPNWLLAAVLYGALLLGLSVPSAPAALGTFELVTVAVLEAFGQPLAPSAAFAVVFHALTF
jgi:uncharacterized membrane protein YbhN (UPF0104 family)